MVSQDFFENLQAAALVSGRSCIAGYQLELLMAKYGVSEAQRPEVEAFCTRNRIRVEAVEAPAFTDEDVEGEAPAEPEAPAPAASAPKSGLLGRLKGMLGL